MKSLQEVLNRYHIWDSRQMADLLPKEPFVDVTVTSPPYWNLKDYGSETQVGFGQSYEQYLLDCTTIFQEVYDRTKKTGSLWIISDTLKTGGDMVLLPFDMAERLKDVGWILQDIVIWNKDRTLPWSHQGKLRNIFEYITFFTKGRQFKYHLERIREISELKDWWVRYPERYSPKGKAPSRMWNVPIPRQGSWGNNWVRHSNPLPPQLIERILRLTTDDGDTVLDPFAGSGTVLAQASAMGRSFVGLDLNSEYQSMFERRVRPAIDVLHESSNATQAETNRRRAVFETTIQQLRITKYPKEFARLYQKINTVWAPIALLAIGSADLRKLNLAILIQTLPDDLGPLLGQMVELSKRPPLSKYELDVTIQICAPGMVSQETLNQLGNSEIKNLHLYLEGKTYSAHGDFSAQEFVQACKEEGLLQFPRRRYPPIVSNIAVDIDLDVPLRILEIPNE